MTRCVLHVCAGAALIALVAVAFAGYLTPAALASLISGLAFCG